MKTFKILNNTLSFDEDLANYKDIMNKGVDYRTLFLIRYLGLNIEEFTSYSDFFNYTNTMYTYFTNEVSQLIESILQIYVDYKIYDMTSELIRQRNISKINKEQKVFNTMNYFAKNLHDTATEEKSSIQELTANNVNEAVQGHYFDVYSPYYSDIVMNEWFNNREKERVKKKRGKLYNQAIGQSLNQLNENLLRHAKMYKEKFNKEIRQSIENLILPMYEDCINDLISRGKISKGILENLQTSKALAISKNINMIKNKEELKQQLIVALQLDPFICETHTKIIEYISDDDMKEYVELIKFLKLDDEIFKIYLMDYNNHIENTKCLNILKKLTDNMSIDRMVSGLLCRNEYTPESFQVDISYTEKCFKALKNIWGTENTVLNKFEQEIFISMIKIISNGSNLVYDGSINHVNYEKLNEFFFKRVKQDKAKERKLEFVTSLGNWIGKHIKGIIIFVIIIAIFYFASKDSDDTKTNNSLIPEAWQNTQVVEEKKDDNDYIIHENLPDYDSDYEPGKLNPFAAYE